jgi:hypothetical protein
MERWAPREALTQQEHMILKAVERTKKLFAFLRLHRRALFDDGFQDELAAAYRDSGAGKAAHPPAFLAMAVLLQAYTGVSDAEAVNQTVVDLRWQMALDCLGATTPAFSQGALHDFRHRMIRHDLDRRLLERTAELAMETGAFDRKKLPKSLRIAIDSKPLVGAARVEDTVNLLGHAARDVVRCAAVLLEEEIEAVARAAGIPLVLESSTKRALDTDWTNPQKKQDALNRLVTQLRRLLAYVEKHLATQATEPPLSDALEALEQVLEQDLEPDPHDPSGKRVRIREGVAQERRISVRDSEMRHGRKTRTKTFNGYKQHIAVDLDHRLILAASIVPANKAETEATPALKADLGRYKRHIAELQIDRGYVSSTLVDDVLSQGGTVLSKPRAMPPNKGLFTKHDFHFDLRARTVTCPAGQTMSFANGQKLVFDEDTCEDCPLRPRCTRASGPRALQMANDELLQQHFIRAVRTATGRERLRGRIPVEHRLSHLAQKQGPRARYCGKRSNLFDLRRTSAVLNLEVTQYELAEAA